MSFQEHEVPILAKRTTAIPSNSQLQIAYDEDDNPIYVGFAAQGVASSEAKWLIQKLTWTSGNCTLRQIAVNAIWDNRATTVVYT